MRLISFSVMIPLAILSSAVLAQQAPVMPGKTLGETIGDPPPLAGPPPISEPSAKPSAVEGSPPRSSEPAPKGNAGASASSGSPNPYSVGPLQESSVGPGLNVVGPDGVSTRSVKAVPCGLVARETDGFTTCVGIPDKGSNKRGR